MLEVLKVILLFALLLTFAGIGIVCVINPDWGITHFAPSLRGGGELRKDINRRSISLLGLIFAAFALFLIYRVIWR